MARPRYPRNRNRAPGPYRFPRCHPRARAALAGLAMMLMPMLATGQAWAASAPASPSAIPPASSSAPAFAVAEPRLPPSAAAAPLLRRTGRAGTSAPGGAGLARMLNGAKVRAVGLGQFPKWTGALSRNAIEGEGAWTAKLARLRDRDRRGQIEAVNQLVNRARYRDDAVNYGLRDYWATPAELFTRGGDCEDYAFAKFTALRTLGFSNRDLRLVVVYDLARGIPHAVLAVDLGTETLILDSQFNTIFPAARLRRYLPYYSVNEDGGWIHIAGWTTPRTATARGKSAGSLAPAAAAP